MTTDDWDRRLNPFRYDGDGNLTESAKQQDQSLRLDSYDGGRGGGPEGPALHVDASLLKGRADDTDAVAKDFQRVCDAPLKSTKEVPKGLKGFRCAGAFATFEARWQAETSYVEVSLLAKFAEDLRDGAKAFTAQDRGNADKFK